MKQLTKETVALLDDIERRIDPETEESLEARWLRFLNGECGEEIFRPSRDKLTPPGTALPAININDALADYDAMIASEMKGVSGARGAEDSIWPCGATTARRFWRPYSARRFSRCPAAPTPCRPSVRSMTRERSGT